MDIQELKQYYEEYYEKRLELQQLMSDSIITTHEGRCKYFTLKDRITYLEQVLLAENLINEDQVRKFMCNNSKK